MTADSATYLTQLHRLLNQAFNLEEVRTLCFELGIEYDDLGGEGRSDRSRELIRLMARQGRLPNLVTVATEKRPQLVWPSVPADFHLPTSSPEAKPKLSYEPDTVLIPAGQFIMGSDEHDPAEAPQHVVELPAYRIGRFPVTNEEFAHFIWQTGRVAAKELLWDGNQPPPDQLLHPVLGVTWFEALAYCQWLSQATGRDYSLPSEAQWEKAARGTDGRFYPWGNDWQEDRCNHDPDLVTAVNAFPPQSAYGCYDMVGNAREWTTTLWGTTSREPDTRYRYPWQADIHDSLQAPATTRRIFRGGRSSDLTDYRCSKRGSYLPERSGPRRNRHGLRVMQLTLQEGI